MRILFGGDVSFSRGYSAKADSGVNLFAGLRGFISEFDYKVINLESVFPCSEETVEKLGPSLSSPQSSIESLSAFDLIGLSNNHVCDQGELGLANTLGLLKERNISSVGAKDKSGFGQFYHSKMINGVTVGFLAVGDCEFSDYGRLGFGGLGFDVVDISIKITELKGSCDFLILFAHCGTEYYELPSPDLKKKLHYFVDVGADAIVCHHSHTVSGVEVYKDAPIFYSLGNCLFDNLSPTKGWFEGVFVSIEINQLGNYVGHGVYPISNSVDNDGVELLDGGPKSRILNRVSELSEIIKDDSVLDRSWAVYCRNHGAALLMSLSLPFPFKGMSKIRSVFDFLYCSVRKGVLSKRNMLECESHLNVIKRYLLDK